MFICLFLLYIYLLSCLFYFSEYAYACICLYISVYNHCRYKEMSSQSFPSAHLIYEMPGPLTPLLVRVVPSLKIRVQAGYKVRERMRAQVRMWGGRHTLLWGIFVYCCDVEVMWRV